jgi:predicted metal-dependent peptidase
VLGLDVETAGVGLRPGGAGFALYVNPAYFVGTVRRLDERVAVVKHEVLHLLLRHVTRRAGREPERWNLACDVVVNTFVRPWPLPEGAVTRASFPGLQIAADPTADEVYAALAGHVPPPRAWSDHHRWVAEGADADLAEAALERWVRGARDRAHGWGKLPGALAAELEAWLQARTPTVDWRRVVRGFAGLASKSRLQDTTKRPSRRFGTLPGHRIRREVALLVAVDSSGSVSEEALSQFFAEIHGIWRAGAEVTVVTCDAEIQDVAAYRGRPPKLVKGRGGTAFEPVFAWARAKWPRRWDGLVYLTDGEGPAPSTRPGCPVLWVVQGAGGAGLPGRRVQL